MKSLQSASAQGESTFIYFAGGPSGAPEPRYESDLNLKKAEKDKETKELSEAEKQFTKDQGELLANKTSALKNIPDVDALLPTFKAQARAEITEAKRFDDIEAGNLKPGEDKFDALVALAKSLGVGGDVVEFKDNIKEAIEEKVTEKAKKLAKEDIARQEEAIEKQYQDFLSGAKAMLETAKEEFNSAKKDYTEYKSEYDAYEKSLKDEAKGLYKNKKQLKYNKEKADFDEAEKQLTTAETNLTLAKENLKKSEDAFEKEETELTKKRDRELKQIVKNVDILIKHVPELKEQAREVITEAKRFDDIEAGNLKPGEDKFDALVELAKSLEVDGDILEFKDNIKEAIEEKVTEKAKELAEAEVKQKELDINTKYDNLIRQAKEKYEFAKLEQEKETATRIQGYRKTMYDQEKGERDMAETILDNDAWDASEEKQQFVQNHVEGKRQEDNIAKVQKEAERDAKLAQDLETGKKFLNNLSSLFNGGLKIEKQQTTQPKQKENIAVTQKKFDTFMEKYGKKNIDRRLNWKEVTEIGNLVADALSIENTITLREKIQAALGLPVDGVLGPDFIKQLQKENIATLGDLQERLKNIKSPVESA